MKKLFQKLYVKSQIYIQTILQRKENIQLDEHFTRDNWSWNGPL